MIGELKRVGKVLHLSNLTPRILIVRLDKPIRIGTIIYDDKMRELGPIIELFGPTTQPYARVKLNSNWTPKLLEPILGKPCFIIVGDEVKVKWRKKPKKTSKLE